MRLETRDTIRDYAFSFVVGIVFWTTVIAAGVGLGFLLDWMTH